MVEIIIEDIKKISSSSLVLISNQSGILNEKIPLLLNYPNLSEISVKSAKSKKIELGDYYSIQFEEPINKINNIFFAVISDMTSGTSSTHTYISVFNKIFQKIYNGKKSDSVCVIMYPLDNIGIIKNMLAVHIAQIVRSFSDKINIQLFFCNKEDADIFNQFIF